MCRYFHCLIYYLLGLSITNVNSRELFLVRPGDGEDFVYSPVDVNVTLHCAVTSTDLLWEVGNLNFDTKFHRSRLNSRGIFRTEAVTSSNGVTESNVTVFGNLDENNGSRICCQSQTDSVSDIVKECTIIIIYGLPSPPELEPLQFNGKTLEINISWTAETIVGVNQKYTIYFHKEKVVTIQSFYFYHQNTSDSKIRCSTYVTVVNGAGESDPSNNVTIPSLPDIGPVTASLSHQVWKSAGGEIMVNVSFNPALYCVGDPVLEYIITLMSHSEVNRDKITKVLLGSSKTEVTIETSDGLKNNIQYLYKVTARNRVGSTTTNGNIIITSDVQFVIATVVGESTIDIQCLFIHGSDAVGCKVVLVSDHPGVNNETATLIRRNTSEFASGYLEPMQEIGCYQRVIAYAIDMKNITNTFPIEEKLHSNRNIEKMCSESLQRSSSATVIVLIVIITVTLLILVIMVIVIPLSVIILMKKKKEDGNYKTGSDKVKWNNSNCLTNGSGEPNTLSSQNEALSLQKVLDEPDNGVSPQGGSQYSPSRSPMKPLGTSIPFKCHKQNVVTDTNSDAFTTPPPSVPLYAVPGKIKIKEKTDKHRIFLLQKEMEEPGIIIQDESINNEENIYHVLENDRESSKNEVDVMTTAPPASEPSPPLVKDSSPPLLSVDPCELSIMYESTASKVGESVTANYTEDCNTDQALDVPVYAVPDKVRSKTKSVLSQNNCASAQQEETNELNAEHIYHELENDRAPSKTKLIPPDSNTPDLLSSFQLSGAPPPIYQDITESNTKM